MTEGVEAAKETIQAPEMTAEDKAGSGVPVINDELPSGSPFAKCFAARTQGMLMWVGFFCLAHFDDYGARFWGEREGIEVCRQTHVHLQTHLHLASNDLYTLTSAHA